MRKHILIVDDIATNRKCAAEVLNDIYEVEVAKSGRVALELLRKTSPDLILLDINMPEMDGFEVYENLKMDTKSAQIPVIFLASEMDEEMQERGVKLGVSGFIQTPYEPAALRELVANIFSEQERKLGNEEASKTAYNQNTVQMLEKVIAEQKCGCLLLLSVENFKQLQSVLGSEAGEKILQKTALVLQEEAGEKSEVCRIKAGEFAVFFKEEFSRERIRTVLRRMMAGAEFELNEMIPEELDMQVFLMAGIARKPEDAESYQKLYECADKALYYVKQSGKKSYYFYCTELNEAKDMLEEKEAIYILQLQRMLSEKKETADGEDYLNKACKVLSKYWEDKEEKGQVMWLSLEETKDLSHLEIIIRDSLRKGDVAIPYDERQYLIVLKSTSLENATMVAQRICKKTNMKYQIKSI